MICTCVHVMEKDCPVAKKGTWIYTSYTKNFRNALYSSSSSITSSQSLSKTILCNKLVFSFIFQEVNKQLANIICITNTGLFNSSSFIPGKIHGPSTLRISRLLFLNINATYPAHTMWYSASTSQIGKIGKRVRFSIISSLFQIFARSHFGAFFLWFSCFSQSEQTENSY